MAKTKQRDNPTISIRRQKFEKSQEKLLDQRAGTVSNSMETRKILFFLYCKVL